MVDYVMDIADQNYRYPASRYSRDRTTSLYHNVLDGTVYSGLWDSYASLDAPRQARLIKATLAMLESVEQSWDGQAYIQRPNPQLRWAGVQPFNQQNIIGTVMAQYTLATGDERFLPRIAKLRDNLMAETFASEQGLSWRYWPLAHWEGTPPERRAERREDSSHASINAEFLMYADAVLNPSAAPMQLPKTTFSSQLDSLSVRFPHRMNWDQSLRENSVYWAPNVRWARLKDLDNLYKHWLMPPREDYDAQHVLAGYAERLPSLDALEGTLILTRLRPAQDAQKQGETPTGLHSEAIATLSLGKETKPQDKFEALKAVTARMAPTADRQKHPDQ
jgi:hypothetical protein